MSIQFFVAEQGCGTAPTDNLGTGWGPRGDSGSERDRVRATQPAITQTLSEACSVIEPSGIH